MTSPEPADIPSSTRPTRQRIRVWFGNEVICSHVAESDKAERYATLMAQRFAGLAVTIDGAPGPRDAELPHQLLWEQTVQ